MADGVGEVIPNFADDRAAASARGMTSRGQSTSGQSVERQSADDRWLIALDVDGTLVDHDGAVQPAVVEAIRAAQAAGHEVTIATGRPFRGALPVAQQLGMHPHAIIASNGALVVDMLPSGGADASGAEQTAGQHMSGGAYRHGIWEAERLVPSTEPFPRFATDAVRIVDTPSGPVRYRIAQYEDFDPAPVLDILRPHFEGAKFAVEYGDDGYRFDAMFVLGTFGAPVQLASFDELKSEPVSRIVMVSPLEDAEEFHAAVETIGLHQVSYAVGWSSWLDIAPKGVTKASGLETIRRELGIAPSHVLTVGDGFNDLEMTTWAVEHGGIGAAMGHGRDVLKAAASVVVGDLESDGAAEAINLVLSK